MSYKTFGSGCLGSQNDEERSEMRYIVWNAWLRDHQDFERTFRHQGHPGGMLNWVITYPPQRPGWNMTVQTFWLAPFKWSVLGWHQSHQPCGWRQGIPSLPLWH